MSGTHPEPGALMRAEIGEQPEALRRLLAMELPAIRALAEAARERGIGLLFLAARGTSDNAAVYAKYLFEILAGVPVCLAAPSVYTLYESRVRLDGALVMGISQSGEAADALEVLRAAREDGCLTACITNEPASAMYRAVERPLQCHAGLERSLPATKTYTTSLMVVAALCASFAGDDALLAELQQIPAAVEQVLAGEAALAEGAERHRDLGNCVVLARGVNQCTALEVALKLTETSYVQAQPFSVADFMHGPIAVVEEGYPCLLFAPSGRAYENVVELARTLRERGADLIIASDREEALELATTPLRLPSVPELLSPMVAVVAGQLFAYHLARVKGRDPDHPRGLKKVTFTL